MLQCLSTEAFTTALSNDKETSITARIAVIANALNMVIKPAWGPCVKPQYAEIAKQMMVKRIEKRKCFIH